VKMATFLLMGVYRGLWRYTGLDDLIVFVKAVLVSSVLSVLAVLIAFTFQDVSRSVLILDGIVLLMLVAGSRMAFRVFRRILPASGHKDGNRMLIYGAGDAGELLLREILNNKELQYSPIGFVDDDPMKYGKVIHGLRVFGGNGSLRQICREQRINEVVISSLRITEERISEIRTECLAQQVNLKRMTITIEELN